ncbi:MAG: A/G-specific adenine glycosylase [Bacteroidota bacterium]
MSDQFAPAKKAAFTEKLLHWSNQNPRDLAWKATKNPYFIWLSEIILQQTRVEQGTPYYLKFIEQYPTVSDLANALEDEVLKLWEGLGYYSRARNLHFAAKYIHEELNGKFPDQHQDILALKGVGTYTAAAIASFAFDLPHAVVDGNVYRVLSRYFGISTPIDSTAGKKEFAQLAQELLDKKRPADYNQAIMNFGATHCLPKNSKCRICLFSKNCTAFAEKAVANYPVKAKKIKKKYRYFHYLLFNYNDHVWIEKRTGQDIWKGLYQFPVLERNNTSEHFEELKSDYNWRYFFEANEGNFKVKKHSKPYQQTLTHQYIITTFWELDCTKKIELPENKYTYIQRSNIDQYAFPKVIGRYLKEDQLYLF